MKNSKKYILLLITFIIIILILGISILILKLKNNDILINNEKEYHNHGNEDANTSIHVLKDTNTFYIVENCINIYLSDEDKYNNEKEIVAKKIWGIDSNTNISTYYVFAKLRNKNTLDISNEENIYFIVILDKNNNRFSIIEKGNTFSEKDLNDIYNFNDYEIKQTDKNKYLNIIIYNEDIVKKYFSEYVKNALYKSSIAYELLDEEYKSKKFNSIDDYIIYVENNKNDLLNAVLLKYSVEQFDDYTQYTVIDNYNNYYIIKERNVMDFSILLDNYTLQSEEFDSKYEDSSDDVKISTNLDKVFKMINNKEYKKIYENYINKEFRNKYFNNYEKFEVFMKNKFFDYNYLGKTSSNRQGSYYIINVNYKEGLSSAAEERNINIIFKLNSNTNFEFSFEM